MHAVYACVYAASVHFWLSGTVCVGAQVQLLLSPVAVISELRGIISSLQLRSLFHPNYIPVIKMLIRTVKGAIKRVIKKSFVPPVYLLERFVRCWVSFDLYSFYNA